MENETNKEQPNNETKNESNNQTDQIMQSLALLQKKFTDFEAFLSTSNKRNEVDKSVVELPKEEPKEEVNDDSWKDYNF